MLQHAVLHLVPALITFLSESVVASATSSTGEVSQPDGVSEVIKALSTWCGALSDELKPRGYAVLLPTLSLLLDPGQTQGQAPSGLHVIATGSLLGLAQGSPKAFRDATMGMGEGERAGMERAIREAVGGGAGGAGQKAQQGGLGEKKVIELKSFG
jgi:hypothetical protein